MSSPESTLSQSDAGDAFRRNGLEILEEPATSRETGAVPKSVAPSPFFAPPSISDWVISGLFGGFLLAYVTGLALAARWVLQRLFGA